MNSSFYNGLTGMKAQQYGIDLLSDNIANVNTPGFKAVYAEFSTLNAQQQTNQAGMGAISNHSSTDYSSGSLLDTGSQYDMAIKGNGWFGVVDEHDDLTLTRAGLFSRDANGFLVDTKGNHVTGTNANNVVDNAIIDNPRKTINMSDITAQTAIHIPDTLTIPPVATTFINFKGPLNPKREEEMLADGSIVEKSNIEVYRTDVYDSNGNLNKLEITFSKNVPQAVDNTKWSAKAILRDSDNNELSTQTGELSFNTKGALTNNTLTTIDNNGSPVALGFGTILDPNTPNSGYDGLVSLAGIDSSRDIDKDGQASGKLSNYGIDDLGNIQAAFTNGKTVPIAKVAIYQIRNEGGLEKVGNSNYKTTVNSGEASFFKDQEGNTIHPSSILTKKIEISNINLSTALTELIVMQKAFDASSKSITTSDQLIQNAINMKR